MGQQGDKEEASKKRKARGPYRGGVITSQWPGMWGQEWGIEASFRLRIMDYLPKHLSLWVVLFLTWGTYTYICCNSCLISLTSSVMPSNTSFESFLRTHPFIHTSETPWNQTVWSNTRPDHRETNKSRTPMFPLLQFRPIQIPPPNPRSPNASISETPRECLQRPLSTV